MIIAIIQARMGSNRFPGKVMENVAGIPLLAHVVRRAKKIVPVDKVVVATSVLSTDDPIVRWCDDNDTCYFRGSENDVLDRYFQTAFEFHADTIVRITADCPLLDPAISSQVLQHFEKTNNDYVSNTLQRTFPDGLDTEVFSFFSLKLAWKSATRLLEREHVTPYIINNPDRFNLYGIQCEKNLSHHRWTVDHPEDLTLVSRILDCADTLDISFREILNIIERYPELAKLNSHFETNEGYGKSLAIESKEL